MFGVVKFNTLDSVWEFKKHYKDLVLTVSSTTILNLVKESSVCLHWPHIFSKHVTIELFLSRQSHCQPF